MSYKTDPKITALTSFRFMDISVSGGLSPNFWMTKARDFPDNLILVPSRSQNRLNKQNRRKMVT